MTETRSIWPARRRGVLGGAVLATLALSGCGDATASDVDESLRFGTAATRDILLRVEAAGVVEPIRLVEVKSNAGGEILRMHVDTGDEVVRGALLAEIDPRDVRSSYNQSRADLEVARAAFATREAQLRRATELREAGIMTLQEHEAAELDLANARAQLIRAETNLELAEERMGDITIRAPIAGTVVSKAAEAGQIAASATANVGGGTPLLTMADLSEMQVRTLVDQTDIGNIHMGQLARVTVDAYRDRTFTGTIAKIEPQAVIEQNVTMFPVIIRLANPERLLLPGMNADVEVTVQERRGVVAVPNGAILNPRDGMTAASLLGIGEDEFRARLRPTAAAGTPGDAEAAGELRGDCAEVIERLRGGGRGGLSEEDRDRMAACREELAVRFQASGGGSRGPGGGEGLRSMGAGPTGEGRVLFGGPGGSAGGGAGMRVQGGQSASASAPRAAVLLVETESGPEPRLVRIGAYDLDYTEVMDGVEPGERVLMMSLAQLEQRQRQQTEMIRSRSGGVMGGLLPGGGRVRIGGGGR